MTPPIRAIVHTAVGYENAEEMTLRDVAEYFKKVARLPDQIGQLTSMELRQVNQSWNSLMAVIAEREKVPQGWLSYTIGELARGEMRAAMFAEIANES